VYGVPSRMIHATPTTWARSEESRGDQTRGQEGYEAFQRGSSDARRGAGDSVSFPRSNEITRKDKVEFDAEVGQLKFTQDFLPDEMVYQDKLEL